MHVCIYIYIYTCVYIYIYIHTYIHMYISLSMYVYIYIYIHIHTFSHLVLINNTKGNSNYKIPPLPVTALLLSSCNQGALSNAGHSNSFTNRAKW